MRAPGRGRCLSEARHAHGTPAPRPGVQLRTALARWTEEVRTARAWAGLRAGLAQALRSRSPPGPEPAPEGLVAQVDELVTFEADVVRAVGHDGRVRRLGPAGALREVQDLAALARRMELGADADEATAAALDARCTALARRLLGGSTHGDVVERLFEAAVRSEERDRLILAARQAVGATAEASADDLARMLATWTRPDAGGRFRT